MGRIALNLMGGDNAPQSMIAGALQATDLGHELILIGTEKALAEASGSLDPRMYEPRLSGEAISFTDKNPVIANKRLANNPVRVGAELVKNGEADALVDCGNTAVSVAAGIVYTGRIRGVRPAIAVALPRLNRIGNDIGNKTLLLDAGANKEVTPEKLGQFGLMGSIYMELVSGIREPRVGILSNGEEDEKGTALIQEGSNHLRTLAAQGLINFIGRIEGNDIYNDRADVAVTDGFTGNVVLKSNEGMATMVNSSLEDIENMLLSDSATRPSGELMKRYCLSLQRDLRPEQRGGAILLGILGVIIIGHGASKPDNVARAISQAREVYDSGVITQFQERLEAAKQR